MGGAIRSITSIFGGGSQPQVQTYTPPPPPPPPTMADPAVQAAERRQRMSGGAGVAANMLTGGEGITAEEDTAKTAKKYLLGS